MSDQEIVIRVDQVYKDFKLPHQRKNSVKSVFTSIFERKSGKNTETQHALKDISFEIKKGEFFGIVGRNGSGKSTLLKILAGIYQPTKGSVGVTGKLVPFIELGVGFNPELTGRENVFLNGALLGFEHQKVAEMYDDIVDFAELEKFMDQKLKNYSSGMQVRLAFSMAIRADADILLIDEVLAVGDADFQRKCFKYFKNLKKNKKTVVFVSHDMSAVESYCDRAILIDGQRIVSRAPVAKIAEEYLRLFEELPVDENIKNKDTERWGNKKAQFTDVEAQVTESSTIDIFADIKINQAMDNPIFGFQIKNSEGVIVCGTNNKVLKMPFGSADANTRALISWKVPNIFSEGSYAIDLAISEEDEITQCDWWNEATIVQVKNKFSTPHITSPHIKMGIKQKT